MNNNYLWDRTGEPDKELQQLEELLGELRYQPRPLQIPDNIRVGRRRSFIPALAIAATLLFAVAIGLWLNVNRRSAPQPEQPHDDRSAQTNSSPSKTATNETATTKDAPKHKTARRQMVARSFAVKKRPRTLINQPELTAQELAQKEQLVYALRMVSAKLNVAQRKTLGTPQTNIIRNQHKIG
jgi:hypothetical protein